jgi:hypothetical protein
LQWIGIDVRRGKCLKVAIVPTEPKVEEPEPVFVKGPSGTRLCLIFFWEEMHEEAHCTIDTVS